MDNHPMTLRDAMSAATAAAPPSALDIDRLIATEQRRQRSVRTFSVAGGAALGVLAVTLATAGFLHLRPAAGLAPANPGTGSAPATTSAPRLCPSLPPDGEPRAYQSGAPAPLPVSESCGDATHRLDVALAKALRSQAPDATFADSTGSDQPIRFVQANDLNLTYIAGLSIRTPGHRGMASVEVMPTTYGPDEAELRRAHGCDRLAVKSTCVFRTLSDGAVVSGVQIGAQPARPGILQDQISIFRADHTTVRIVTNNVDPDGPRALRETPRVGGETIPLTLDQIIAIGTDPGLTIYP